MRIIAVKVAKSIESKMTTKKINTERIMKETIHETDGGKIKTEGERGEGKERYSMKFHEGSKKGTWELSE